jgi:proteasome lid subunit RPN8/RPN11
MHGTQIVLNQQTLQAIYSHVAEGYPEECCGLLIGLIEGETKTVINARRMKNVFEKSEKFHRYTIDPVEYMNVENEIESDGKEIVGIYHSHPNAPPKPSLFDKQHAWPTLSYVVVEVRDSKPVKTLSWVLKDDRSEFIQEEFRVSDQPRSDFAKK